jgi:ubiquinone/menaquinone biosynthesis C-methylase UbiE
MADRDDYYRQRTIASWDEAAPVHAAINTSLHTDVASPDFNSLNPDFNDLVDAYGVSGKAAVQICCNNGIDLLSLRKKGAGRCLGIDGSSAFLEHAADLARSAGHPDIEFHCSDVHQLPDKFHHSFEIAITTVGVLGWMPDIERFMGVCASLLGPGGVLLVEELHPILGMYEEGKPSTLDYSYFNTEPFVDANGLDYFTYKKYDAIENYSFHHSLSDVLMAAIASGLQLEHVKELSYNIGNFCADLEFVDNNPPLGINFAWRKAQ